MADLKLFGTNCQSFGPGGLNEPVANEGFSQVDELN